MPPKITGEVLLERWRTFITEHNTAPTESDGVGHALARLTRNKLAAGHLSRSEIAELNALKRSAGEDGRSKPSAIEEHHNRFRVKMKLLGQTRSGPSRITEEEAQADVDAVLTGTTPKEKLELIAALKRPAAAGIGGRLISKRPAAAARIGETGERGVDGETAAGSSSASAGESSAHSPRKRMRQKSPAGEGASGKLALVVKRHWLNLILDDTKTWEIRGAACNVRGLIKLAQSGSGQLMGEARVVDSISFKDLDEFKNHPEVWKSGIPPEEMHMVKYRNIFAWVLEDAKRYNLPQAYAHPQGAVTWVKL